MTATRWLDEQEQAAWQSFLEATHRVERRLERQLREDAGLSHPQYEVLVRLAREPEGAMRMTELARALITSKSGLTYQIGQLEKRGLVSRSSCPEDVRGVRAQLTDEGRQVLKDTAPGHVEAVRVALIDPLTREELTTVAEALGRIGERLREPGTPERGGKNGHRAPHAGTERG
ncbi:MarR family transcriptional regulator [Streptomyces sp. NPDC005438]|uniref:MarR family winged helix-turn-helix transcriptional regulator n=1 Tax=Streptomyces sp. NPDC005438 TaxID=3156880 RepID=UPI0033A22CCC